MKQNIREAMLYEPLPDSRVRCNVCQWRCVIGPDKFGVCRVRQNRDGKLYLLNYALVSSAAVDPIEKKPLFHFYPRHEVFSLGGWGCNFHCQACQNWEIACTDVPTPAPPTWSAPRPPMRDGQAARLPRHRLDLQRAGHLAGVHAGLGQAGQAERALHRLRHQRLLTPEALDAIGPYLDAWRVDIKGFYRRRSTGSWPRYPTGGASWTLPSGPSRSGACTWRW